VVPYLHVLVAVHFQHVAAVLVNDETLHHIVPGKREASEVFCMRVTVPEGNNSGPRARASFPHLLYMSHVCLMCNRFVLASNQECEDCKLGDTRSTCCEVHAPLQVTAPFHITNAKCPKYFSILRRPKKVST